MRFKRIIPAVALIGALAIPAAASASVSVDNGVGWAGKGDVQTALGGINNASIQNLVNSNGLSFTQKGTETWSYDEEWFTGPTRNRVHHVVTKSSTQTVDAAVSYDARMVKGQKQWTGFNLTGLSGSPVISGDHIPTEGEVLVVDPQAPGTNADHIATNVTMESSTSGLFVNGNALPNTPVEVAPTA